MASKCWFPSKENGFELGIIISDGDPNIIIEAPNGKGRVTAAKKDIHRFDPTHLNDNDDLCSMNHLHEAPLLDSLRRRFAKDKIYTNTGDVLISLNPYKRIPGLYENILAYLDVSEDGEIDPVATKPHVFKVANNALVAMLYGKKSLHEHTAPRNQSVIVSGESGAGKTEASKLVMNFFIAADGESHHDPNSHSNELGDKIKQVLVESNVIFEAFGNAKTVRNDNSSRFGKYIKLQFSDNNRLISAFSETFLLEKSRLMSVGQGERNYHVFYQFLRGNRDPTLTNKLKLKDCSEYKMLLDESGRALVSEMDDQYQELLNALSTLGCSNGEREQLWTILAAILHMGNLTVTILTDLDNSKESGVTVPDNQPINLDVGHVRIACPTIPLSELAELLGLPGEMLVSRLSTQRVKVGNRRSVTIKRLNVIEINNNVQSMIKWIYSSIFSWLISKINFAHCSVSSSSSDIGVAKKFAGILDIFGFEILQKNSFEQLCINFTNERLQQQFNEFVFDREQDLYKAEGLDWAAIEYKDNQNVIDLIGTKPSGLLIILEGQGMLNRGAADEGALISAFNSTHDKLKSTAYEKSRFTSDGRFTIKHFAGDVVYHIGGFLEKNNDSLQEDLMELMVCSSNAFVQNAIVCPSTDAPGMEGELGFIPELDPSKIVASAGSLSMSSRGASAAKVVGGEDPMKKMRSTGRRTSLVVQPSDTGAGGGSSGKKMASTVTVSFQFRSQLDILLLNLRSTSPHYIKCVKPNSIKQAGVFDAGMVLEQLRYSGALEVVRIRQEGFPISMSFTDFYSMFEVLSFKRNWLSADSCPSATAKQYCLTLLQENLQEKIDFQLGLTKAFLKSEAYEKMHLALNMFLGLKLRKLQALVRQRQKRLRYQKAKKGMIFLQAWIRTFVLRLKFKRLMKSMFDAREKERLRLIEEKRRMNMDLEQRLLTLFAAANSGDVESMSMALSLHPDDYHTMRDVSDNNCTVLQAAARSGSLRLVQMLQPSRDDLFVKDDNGNTAIHYAIMSEKKSILSIVKYFSLVNANESEQLSSLVAEMKVLGLVPRVGASSLPVPPPKSAAAMKAGITTRSSLATTQVPTLEEGEDAIDSNNDGKQQAVELKSGWMSKRGESSIWRKRWVVLTTEALMYFRNNKDKVPRDTLSFARRNEISIQRAPTKATGIDIYINQQSVKKKRDRVSLMAESEQEMQAWLNLLKAAAGVEVKPLRAAASSTSSSTANATTATPLKPLLIVKPAWTSLLFKVTNNARETPLHVLCGLSRQASTSADMSIDDQLELTTWMVTNMSPLNAFNGKGLTPLQVAVQAGNEALAGLLTKFGADPAKAMFGATGARTSYDLVKGAAFHELLKQASKVFEQRESSFLPMPPRLRGFHYLSMIFYRGTTMENIDVSTVNDIALKVSTFNANQLPAEPFQISPASSVGADGKSLQWFEQFHLQIPLDNLEDHAFAVVELIHKASVTVVSAGVVAKAGAVENATTAPASATVIAWTKIPLDRDIINSETKTLTLYLPPVAATASNNAAAGTTQVVHSTMEVELLISKR